MLTSSLGSFFFFFFSFLYALLLFPPRSSFLSFAKLLYYRAFAFLYCLAGSYATTVMVNSSWTEAHIRSIWTRTPAAAIHRVYPPCNTTALQVSAF